MIKKNYNKIPLNFENQLELLKSRGLAINDEKESLSYLKEISYYRLSAYFLPYQKEKDKFNVGTTFSEIIQTYLFDRDLRLFVFECIERIEIAIRTQIIYNMSLHYNDSHWHDNQSLFITPYYNKLGFKVDPYNDLQSIISKAKTARTPEVYIKHYMDNYDSPINPPSWMCFELLTIGELSHIYRGLNFKADKKRIADFFEVPSTVFSSWLHSLTYVRNLCAHHSRLWNRDLAIEPEKIIKAKGKWISKPFENNKRVFYILCILRYLFNRINSNNQMNHKVVNLFLKYPSVPIKYIGIPSDGKGNMLDWKNEPLWT